MSDDTKVVSLSGARDKEKTKKKDTVKEAAAEPKGPITYCSFCGRPNTQVLKMIKGPEVNICSECVMICVQYFILEDRVPSVEAQKVLDALWKGAKS